ncbi:hypothetical protein DLAC_11531 [Tieghemostelium lacteum]|uniref:C2H2-type domain-containing protein n=1 Tax=Tieghemostelium lacteum TaxID=361077 RepID=A0A152A3J3_TIELA|nr:hypothetical protein DLAC_11531 [Tieghemostelium lacteum]|eukprot:KYR00818.1 hypothetical protein DLAC_11531 [Tieghemostelium lacteum]
MLSPGLTNKKNPPPNQNAANNFNLFDDLLQTNKLKTKTEPNNNINNNNTNNSNINNSREILTEWANLMATSHVSNYTPSINGSSGSINTVTNGNGNLGLTSNTLQTLSKISSALGVNLETFLVTLSQAKAQQQQQQQLHQQTPQSPRQPTPQSPIQLPLTPQQNISLGNPSTPDITSMYESLNSNSNYFFNFEHYNSPSTNTISNQSDFIFLLNNLHNSTGGLYGSSSSVQPISSQQQQLQQQQQHPLGATTTVTTTTTSTVTTVIPTPQPHQPPTQTSTNNNNNNNNSNATATNYYLNTATNNLQFPTQISSNGEFICKWNNCDMKFDTLTEFWIHFRTDHFKNKPAINPTDDAEANISAVNCDWETCGMAFKDFQSLIGHIKFSHLLDPCDPVANNRSLTRRKKTSIKDDKLNSNNVHIKSVDEMISQEYSVNKLLNINLQQQQQQQQHQNEIWENNNREDEGEMEDEDEETLIIVNNSNTTADKKSTSVKRKKLKEAKLPLVVSSGVDSNSASVNRKPRKRRSSDPPGPFECKWGDCKGVVFEKLSDLGDHLSDHVKNQKGKKSESHCEWNGCTRGDKPLKSAYNLIHHLRYKHTGEKPFHCDYPDCDSRFVQLSDLNEHKRNIHKFEDGYVKKKRNSKPQQLVIESSNITNLTTATTTMNTPKTSKSKLNNNNNNMLLNNIENNQLAPLLNIKYDNDEPSSQDDNYDHHDNEHIQQQHHQQVVQQQQHHNYSIQAMNVQEKDQLIINGTPHQIYHNHNHQNQHNNDKDMNTDDVDNFIIFEEYVDTFNSNNNSNNNTNSNSNNNSNNNLNTNNYKRDSFNIPGISNNISGSTPTTPSLPIPIKSYHHHHNHQFYVPSSPQDFKVYSPLINFPMDTSDTHLTFPESPATSSFKSKQNNILGRRPSLSSSGEHLINQFYPSSPNINVSTPKPSTPGTVTPSKSSTKSFFTEMIIDDQVASTQKSMNTPSSTLFSAPSTPTTPSLPLIVNTSLKAISPPTSSSFDRLPSIFSSLENIGSTPNIMQPISKSTINTSNVQSTSSPTSDTNNSTQNSINTTTVQSTTQEEETTITIEKEIVKEEDIIETNIKNIVDTKGEKKNTNLIAEEDGSIRFKDDDDNNEEDNEMSDI